MTATANGQVPADPNWETYAARQFAARDTYLACVQEAQRHYDTDVRAAIDTYHNVEVAAWHAYHMELRAAERRYLEAGGVTGGKPGTGPAPLIPAPVPADPLRGYELGPMPTARTTSSESRT